MEILLFTLVGGNPYNMMWRYDPHHISVLPPRIPLILSEVFFYPACSLHSIFSLAPRTCPGVIFIDVEN
jgi:hypothetical protein